MGWLKVYRLPDIRKTWNCYRKRLIIGIGATKNKSYQITETGRQKQRLFHEVFRIN